MTEEKKKYMAKQMALALPVMRKTLNLKQTDVCEKTGVSRSILSGVECGRRTLSWDTFLTLVPLFWANERTRSLFKVFDIDMDGLQEYLTVK